MVADVPLQVWLETNANAHPSIVVPYVQSTEEKQIHYELRATNKGHAGTSEVSQSGTISIPAKTPTALSKMSLSTTQDSRCQIDLTLTESGMPANTYHFDCPR
ncbi:MAG: hypothetical protein EPN76_08535 [Burkholderiaceae bacterium]|nr:MAG: hypothetical protein EPN76_08535 [Burkholderiaceae bacterium]TAM05789.1 MAG: hypothetical protein EPN67_06290 [Pusillimonas sp.]